MFAAAASAAERFIGEFSPRTFANTAWAFANADQSDMPLFAAVARAAE